MRLFIVVLIAAILTGCAVTPERPPAADAPAEWRTRQIALAQIKGWELRGRLALQNTDTGFQASLQWLRSDDMHRIDIIGPLGGGRVRLTQDQNGATLRDQNGKTHRDVSIRQLLRRATGWDLPLEGLNYWALGLPAPTLATYELDEWGRLKKLEQSDWIVTFLDYARYSDYELPMRLFIKHRSDGGTGDALEVRLVIEQWHVTVKP